MRLGILGGTFDPVHVGHMIIAQEAAAVLALDEVWFMPTGRPWMKEGTDVTPAYHRMEMLRLAVEHNPIFKLNALEAVRPGLSYTVDTLETLKTTQPAEEILRPSDTSVVLMKAEDKDAALFFILGMDSLETLPRWKEPHRLFDLCTLVAVSRPGHGDFDRASLDGIRPGASSEVVFLEGPDIGISGAEIRRRVQRGLPITYWVPQAVEEYIHEHGLYQEAGNEQ